MKKVIVSILKQALVLFLAQLFPVLAFAYDFESGGIFYNIVYDDVTVTKGDSKYIGDIIIPSHVSNKGKIYKVSVIDNYAFQNCNEITSITINAEIERIGANAFEGLNISSLVLPETVARIEVTAFANCCYLTQFVIPDSVTSIGNGAFQNCTLLERVTIGNGLEKIPENCFKGCINLKTVALGNKVNRLSSSAFKNCKELLSINCSESVETIDSECFMGCEKLPVIEIGVNGRNIGTSAFANCKNLSRISLSEGLTYIGDYAFSGCENLRCLYVPCSLTNTGGHVFSGCKNLQSVIFGTKDSNAETKIGNYMFDKCEKLRSLILGSNVESVGIYNFSQVGKLDSIVSYSLVPPSVDERTFLDYLHFEYTDSIYEHTTLYVPAEALAAYKTHEVWKKFFHIKAIEDEQIALIIKYADNGVVKIIPQKGEQYELLIEPSNGWKIHTVSFDGEDVTSQVTNGQIFKTPAILKSSLLNVAFEQIGSAVRLQSSDSNVKVMAKNGQIIVTGVMAGERIDVYTIDGKVVCSEVANANIVYLSLLPEQLYIVKAAGKIIKIAL